MVNVQGKGKPSCSENVNSIFLDSMFLCSSTLLEKFFLELYGTSCVTVSAGQPLTCSPSSGAILYTCSY